MTFRDFCNDHEPTIRKLAAQGEFTQPQKELLSLFLDLEEKKNEAKQSRESDR